MKTKRELKEEYKQLKFKMGVFQIRNTVNGKLYLDHSVNLDAIWNRHRVQLNFGSHPNTTLQEEWNSYGSENFRYEILAELEQKEGDTPDYKHDLKLLESMYRKELQPFNEKGYHQKKES